MRSKLFCVALMLLPCIVLGQSRSVQTVAGSTTSTALGDGGPATAASLIATEGVWMDQECNIYISDRGHSLIRKVVTSTGDIGSVAGIGLSGFGGDGGDAYTAQFNKPMGLYVDTGNNVFVADAQNNRIRKITARTGKISTVAGGGSFLMDGVAATASFINNPQNVYGDDDGNIYVAETGNIRVVSKDGLIKTIAGNGTPGYSGDGALATAAQVSTPVGMVMDGKGNLYFCDRNNNSVRRVEKSTGIITTIAGSLVGGYAGDGGPATAAQLLTPMGLAFDTSGLVIADNGNNYVRRVDLKTGIITTIAGVGTTGGSSAEQAPATATQMHPEFLYLDQRGNLFYSNYGQQVRKVVNCVPGLAASGSRCSPYVGVPGLPAAHVISVFPNPASSRLTVRVSHSVFSDCVILSMVGNIVRAIKIDADETEIDINDLPEGVYSLMLHGEGVSEVRRFVKVAAL